MGVTGCKVFLLSEARDDYPRTFVPAGDGLSHGGDAAFYPYNIYSNSKYYKDRYKIIKAIKKILQVPSSTV